MAPPPPSPASTNHLVNRMQLAARHSFSESCEEVDLVFEQVLAEQGEPLDHVYFPLSGYVSQISKAGGRPLEIALTGNEGMFGLSVLLGGPNSHVFAVVQGPGRALRMRAAKFRRHVSESKQLSAQLDLFTLVSLSQLGIQAECSRFHGVDKRLARWLLMTADRAHSTKFRVTHEFLAYMLGIRRVGITVAATKLQAHGVIRYSRGDIEILDFPRLRAASCSCYTNSVFAYDDVFGSPASRRTTESTAGSRGRVVKHTRHT